MTLQTITGGFLVYVDGWGVFGFADGNISGWSEEQRLRAEADVVANLELALAEAVELRTPGRLVRALLKAGLATLLLAALLRGLFALNAWVRRRLSALPGAEDGARGSVPVDALRLDAGRVMRLLL